MRAIWGGGLVACIPARDAGRAGLILLVAGGPVSSLLLSAAAFHLAFVVGGWWGGALVCTSALSVVVALVTLMPYSRGGHQSDGSQLLGLLRNDDVTRHRLALTALTAQFYSGVRPRDWDPQLFHAATAPTSGPRLRAMAAALAASRAEDCQRLDEADDHWRCLAELLSSGETYREVTGTRGGYALCLASWIGYRRGEAGSARRWLDASRGTLVDPTARSFAEAAVAWAEHDLAAARRHLSRAMAAIPRLANRGGAIAFADTLDEMERLLIGRAPVE